MEDCGFLELNRGRVTNYSVDVAIKLLPPEKNPAEVAIKLLGVVVCTAMLCVTTDVIVLAKENRIMDMRLQLTFLPDE